jgi:hypothetical protein
MSLRGFNALWISYPQERRLHWQGDPRVNIQNYKGKAKAYQVKQVLKAIERLEVEHGT